MFIIRPAFVGFSPYSPPPPQKIKIFFVGLNINDYLCTRKQESLCFHLHYRRRGSCLIPGPAVKTTQTGRSFYKPEAYRVSPLYHGGAAARLRQRSVQTSQWWRAFQGRGFLSLFFVSKNLFPQYCICKIHI